MILNTAICEIVKADLANAGVKQSQDFFLFREVQEEVLSIHQCIFLAKAAVADFAADIVTVHVLVPEHAPDQPEN